jgi:NADH:ubiquinone oxidoreductase subunit E
MSIQKILLKYEPKAENILPAIKDLAKSEKYLSQKECEKIAEYFSLSLAQVYSTATFYDLVKTKKTNKKTIKVCSGGPCMSEKSMEVVKEIEKMLKIELENDAHPKYKLELMSCVGLCDRGPIVMVDDQMFEKVRPETVDDVLKNYL